jgi:hypothetical protein
MIPANLSFHDAIIVAIRREDTSYIFDVESVAVDHGAEVIDGTLIFDDVRRIVVNGEQARELAMVGDDAEILELDELPGPVIRIAVLWAHHASHDEEPALYMIECKGMRWEAEG